MIDAETAIKLIESEFPDLSAELHDEIWDGLLHLQISVFSRLAQKCIDESDKDSLGRVFALALKLHSNGDPAVINAINVSFLEHINFVNGKVDRQLAYKRMPPTLRKAFDNMVEYNARLHGPV